MTIQENIQKLVQDFAAFDGDTDAMYAYIIERGKKLPQLDDTYKTDDNIIAGCQSKAWLYSEVKDGNVIFAADTEAILPRGILALILDVFSNQKAQDIVDADITFIHNTGLSNILSPIRAIGLESMIKRMKADAQIYI